MEDATSSGGAIVGCEMYEGGKLLWDWEECIMNGVDMKKREGRRRGPERGLNDGSTGQNDYLSAGCIKKGDLPRPIKDDEAIDGHDMQHVAVQKVKTSILLDREITAWESVGSMDMIRTVFV